MNNTYHTTVKGATSSESLMVAQAVQVVRRLVALGRPLNKAVHDAASGAGLTRGQVTQLITLLPRGLV